MTELVFVVEEAPEGGYTARAVGESIFTEADDVPQLHANVRDAIRCHLDEAEEPRSSASTVSKRTGNAEVDWHGDAASNA